MSFHPIGILFEFEFGSLETPAVVHPSWEFPTFSLAVEFAGSRFVCSLHGLQSLKRQERIVIDMASSD